MVVGEWVLQLVRLQGGITCASMPWAWEEMEVVLLVAVDEICKRMHANEDIEHLHKLEKRCRKVQDEIFELAWKAKEATEAKEERLG